MLAVDVHRDLGFRERAKTAEVAQRNDAWPPSAFDVEFARSATAPLIPALATLTKNALPS